MATQTYPEYEAYIKSQEDLLNKSPEGQAYKSAESALDAFKKANPNSFLYSGYRADPALKAQYDKIYSTYQAASQPYFAKGSEYLEKNPFTGAQPTVSTMPVTPPTVTSSNTNVTGGAGTGEAIDPSQSTLSPNFAPYIYDMLSRGQGLANLPYQEYTGQRFAGPSGLQQQAFQGLGGLQMPAQFGMASDFLAQAGQRAGSMAYMPAQFGNFYQSPGQYTPQAGVGYTPMQAPSVTSGYQAPSPYQSGRFTSGFQAPTPGPATQFSDRFRAPSTYQAADLSAGITPGSYQAGQFSPGFTYTPQDITTGLGPVGSVQSYMSPYQSAVSDIEAREAQRQADIAGTARGAKYAQAGAFGGARQAIENAEAQRNLATQIGDVRSKGLQSAYDRALAQRAQEAQLGLTAQQATAAGRQFGAERGAQFGLEAQKAGEASRQFGAQYGMQGLGQLLEARKATEQARQFGAGQQMTGAQLEAQFGLSREQASEAARQFNAGQQMTSAQLQAQFGLDAQKADEMSRQFGAQQAARGAEFGAQQGMTAQQANQAAQLQAQQANINAALQAAQQAEQSRQFGYGQQMTGAQLGAQYGLAGAQQSELSSQFGANYGLQNLQQQIAAAQALGGMGTQQFGSQLQGLQALLNAGATQQQFAQQPLDFGYQQFQESMKYPYQQATYMQSLLQGLPLQARPYNEGQSGLSSAISGGLSGLALYNLMNKPQ